MTSITNEEVVEIDLEEIKNSQPAAHVSEEELREEVDELRMRIREDFASEGEGEDEDINPEEVAQEYQEYQVVEPAEDLLPVEEGVLHAVHQNHAVELESVEPEETAEACGTLEVDLAYTKDTLLNEQEIEDALEATTSDLERLDRDDEVEGEDEDEEDGEDQGFYYKTPITIFPPPSLLESHSEPILLYGPSGIVEKLPHRDTSLDQVFDILRNHYEYIPTEKELYLCMPQLDLELGEDNIYCNDTTVVDLLRLLDTCEEYPASLEIKIDCRNRFISKLNSLFDILNDLPPGKRRRLSLNSTNNDSNDPEPAEAAGSLSG